MQKKSTNQLKFSKNYTNPKKIETKQAPHCSRITNVKGRWKFKQKDRSITLIAWNKLSVEICINKIKNDSVHLRMESFLIYNET